jgi:hypothetical protein
MKQRVSALALILVLAGGLLAGSPFHAGERECSMPEMMDCCALAQMQNQTAEVASAKLCCALNCTQPIQTQNTITIKPAAPLNALIHPAAPRPFAPPVLLAHSGFTGPRAESPPPYYLLNLALLI